MTYSEFLSVVKQCQDAEALYKTVAIHMGTGWHSPQTHYWSGDNIEQNLCGPIYHNDNTKRFTTS